MAKESKRKLTLSDNIEIVKIPKLGLSICGYCNEEFNDDTELVKHLEWSLAGQKSKIRYKPKCKKDTEIKIRMGNSLISIEKVSDKQNPTKKSKNFKCDMCDQAFYLVKELLEHKGIVHNPVKCDICYKTFETYFRLHEHLITFHRFHKCEKCEDAIFRYKRDIAKHDQEHHSNIEHMDPNFLNDGNLVNLYVPEKPDVIYYQNTETGEYFGVPQYGEVYEEVEIGDLDDPNLVTK